MPLKAVADTLVLLHLAFILFVVFGGLFVLRWPKVAWAHVPSAIWGALIEFAGWICPITPLENKLRLASGSSGYSEGFIDHYVMPVVYPAGLTPSVQVVLGAAVIAINAVIYGIFFVRRSNRRKRSSGPDHCGQ
jgi:hypothetical protein